MDTERYTQKKNTMRLMHFFLNWRGIFVWANGIIFLLSERDIYNCRYGFQPGKKILIEYVSCRQNDWKISYCNIVQHMYIIFPITVRYSYRNNRTLFIMGFRQQQQKKTRLQFSFYTDIRKWIVDDIYMILIRY